MLFFRMLLEENIQFKVSQQTAEQIVDEVKKVLRIFINQHGKILMKHNEE